MHISSVSNTNLFRRVHTAIQSNALRSQIKVIKGITGNEMIKMHCVTSIRKLCSRREFRFLTVIIMDLSLISTINVRHIYLKEAVYNDVPNNISISIDKPIRFDIYLSMH